MPTEETMGWHPLYRYHVPLVPTATGGNVDTRLVEGCAADWPASCQNLRAHLGWSIEQDRTLAEERRRVHGCADASRVEIDGRWLRKKWDDVDVVRDAGCVFRQWPAIIWVSVIGGDVVDGLRAVEKEDVLFISGDGYYGLAGFKRLDEDGRHPEEAAVIEVAVVIGSARFHELGLWGGVGGADVVGFAKVIP